MKPDDPNHPGPEGKPPEEHDERSENIDDSVPDNAPETDPSTKPRKRKSFWARDPDNDADWDDDGETTDDSDEWTEEDGLERRVDELMERSIAGKLTDAQCAEIHELSEADPKLRRLFEDVSQDADLLHALSAESVEAHGLAPMRRRMLATAQMYRFLKHITRWTTVLMVALVVIGVAWDPFEFGFNRSWWPYTACLVALMLGAWAAPRWIGRWSAELRSGALGPSRVTLEVFDRHARTRRRMVVVHDWILTPIYISGMFWVAWLLWDGQGRLGWAIVFVLLGLSAMPAWIPGYRRRAFNDWEAAVLSVLSEEDRERVRQADEREGGLR